MKFLGISFVSAAELEYHLIFARNLNVLRDGEFRSLVEPVEEAERMLTGLMKRLCQLQSREIDGTRPGSVASGP
jgi:four helix bundle protein